MTKPTFRVIVAGTRDFAFYEMLCAKLDIHLSRVKDTHQVIILSGACPTGADRLGEEYAKEHGYLVEKHPANWDLGKRAGPIRNQEMVDIADALVAFWNGKSRGTNDVIKRAKAKKIPVMVHRYTEKPKMTPALKRLEEWARKHYRFAIQGSGFVQPGDGYNIRLSAGGRTVSVNEEDIHEATGEWPTLDEIIHAALDKWHADKTIKNFQVVTHDGTPSGFIYTNVTATSEEEARKMVPGDIVVIREMTKDWTH